MTDNELLCAISNMLDTKLKPMEGRMERMEGRVERVEGCMDHMDDRMERIEGRIERMEGRMERMEGQLVQISNWMVQIDNRTKKLEVMLEFDIKPRLQNIEACYTSTYDRYKSGVEQIETMQADIDIMKKVLEEHSEKLQKIC